MPFSVVHGSPQDIWVPLTYGTTIYMGGMVSNDQSASTEGIEMMPQAAGVWNDTNYDIPFGVAIGNNNRRPLFNSTGKCEYITSATSLASTTEFVGHGSSEYPFAREAFAKVSVVNACSVLRANLVDAAVTGAPAVGTVTTASGSDGLDCTAGAASVANIDSYSTIYFRTGANAGTYRVLDSTSATSHTWDTPCYAAVAVGDTVVVVNIRPVGLSKCQLLATYMTAFDINEACTSHYFGIDVVRLNLAEQYKEYVEFMWNPVNWLPFAGRASEA